VKFSAPKVMLGLPDPDPDPPELDFADDPQADTSRASPPSEATMCAFFIAAGYPFRDKLN
jgi:hypothetical protein